MSRIYGTISIAAVLGLSFVACKNEQDIKPDPPGNATADVGPVGDAEQPPGCPTGLRGAPMVEVKTPKGAKYCIDSREVSQADYFEFLSVYLEDPTANHKPKEGAGKWRVGPGCEFSQSLTPDFISDAPCSTTPEAFSQKNQFPHNPVTCVDWCNAYAYCAWAGKRLCGVVGGGAWAGEQPSNPDQWESFNVCSQGGETTYPYGDEFRADVLSARDIRYQTADGEAKRPAQAADAPTDCHPSSAPTAAVVNVGCNVAEWQGACRATDYWTLCLVQGVADGEKPRTDSARCDASIETGMDVRELNIGFRCCHD